MAQNAAALKDLIADQPVIPVIRITDADKAVPMAKALVAGGLPVIEVTLRTPVALEAIRRIASDVPGARVGAGTVLSARQFKDAADVGSTFIVSPGLTQELMDAASKRSAPLLPGVVTPSEMMAAYEEGYTFLKFFPAEQAGGAAYLKAISSPLAGLVFCPTGGISAGNATDYLGLPNVRCVGGSWVAPDKAMAEGRWADIEALAREATGLRA